MYAFTIIVEVLNGMLVLIPSYFFNTIIKDKDPLASVVAMSDGIDNTLKTIIPIFVVYSESQDDSLLLIA